MTDAAMRLVRETVDTGRPIHRSSEFIVDVNGPINYHCAECGTLLVRHAGPRLPDVILICPVCLSLNEPAPADDYVGRPRSASSTWR